MIDIGGYFNDDLIVEGMSVDRAETSANNLMAEIFPDTCTDNIPNFERVFGISPPAGATATDRRNAIIAKMRSRNGLNKSFFYKVAAAFGYAQGIAGDTDPHIRIVDGNTLPFILGVTPLGSKIYNGGTEYNRYSVRIYGTGVATNTALQEAFKFIKVPIVTLNYYNE